MNDSFAILALKALDGLLTRADATAQNIANTGTVGYRPVRVRFEDALAAAAQRGDAAVRNVSPQITAVPTRIDRTLRLDLEMQTATATALRYQAIVDVLSRRMQVHELVLSGSR